MSERTAAASKIDCNGQSEVLMMSMELGRPHFSEILKALDFIIEKDYPGRGEA